MRPIDKGAVPLDTAGNPKTVSDYKNWRKDLIDRIGNYCSYCNMVLNDSPQVEHVIAQDINPLLALDWNNMLLACGACNRTKSAQACPPTTHYLPNEHNTHLAFNFVVGINPRQSNEPAIWITWRGLPALQNKSESTYTYLCALDRDTTSTASQVTDLRWKHRYEAWLAAIIWRQNWNTWGHTIGNDFILLLLTVAEGKGFWSIWFEIFRDVRAIRLALINAFAGTAQNCFDADGNPIPRNPTNPLDTI